MDGPDQVSEDLMRGDPVREREWQLEPCPCCHSRATFARANSLVLPGEPPATSYRVVCTAQCEDSRTDIWYKTHQDAEYAWRCFATVVMGPERPVDPNQTQDDARRRVRELEYELAELRERNTSVEDRMHELIAESDRVFKEDEMLRSEMVQLEFEAQRHCSNALDKELPPLNPRCAKCGWRDAKMDLLLKNGGTARGIGQIMCSPSSGLISCTCQKCGFGWDIPALDAEAKP